MFSRQYFPSKMKQCKNYLIFMVFCFIYYVIIIIIIIIIAIMIMVIKTILIIVILIINSPFKPGDCSTGSTTEEKKHHSSLPSVTEFIFNAAACLQVRTLLKWRLRCLFFSNIIKKLGANSFEDTWYLGVVSFSCNMWCAFFSKVSEVH